ncbi:MAG: AAA family ATPase [Candidatus Heimdallarchaeum endolithica]|uniref:AAA family ATPase n=1 Tax=Candidatus Heimdallarchaeum endolithica TaxID=2876572 RepID=A0A9Y1BPZ6_9ARCH|nr:MAG: AAA family ATPase [Candidatus Heimdallarchaeum endolithica]
MTSKIKKVKINSLRGIRDLELQIDGKKLLIYGENGTGKSSIVDAIEFFFSGTISHLKGVRGISLQNHGPHIHFEKDDMNVEITFNPGNITLTRNFSFMSSPPEHLKSYFQITQKSAFILRRSQVLEFIISRPAERFRAIGSIIGIESLDNIELEMKKVFDKIKGDIEFCNKQFKKIKNELSNIMNKKIGGIDDILPTINKMLKEVNYPQMKSLEMFDEYSEKLLSYTKKTKSFDKIHLLKMIRETTTHKLVEEEIEKKIYLLNTKITKILDEDFILKKYIHNILYNGLTILKEQKSEKCPLCEQDIERQNLMERVESRLNTLNDLSNTASEIRELSANIIKEIEVIVNKLNNVNLHVKLVAELSELSIQIEEQVICLKEIIKKISSTGDFKSNIEVKIIEQQFNKVKKLWKYISKKSENLLEVADISKEEKEVLDKIRKIEKVRNKTVEILNVQSKIKKYQKSFILAEKMYYTFSEVKKAKIQEIFRNIQNNIQQYFKIIHPSEPFENIELHIIPERRASTELRLDIFGREREDPRALISEGHLDSLGLCIFLSFIKKFNKDCSLIILDDVVSTVDSKHRENICKLLLEEFKDKQLIITTHDELWYDQLLSYQRVYNMENDFKNMVIVKWSINTGPIIQPYKTRWERIQEKIDKGDKNGAGNEGRQYLEWILTEICERMRAQVSFKKSGRYELGELLDSAKKRLDKLLKDSEFKDKIKEAFENLETKVFLGNILSHENKITKKVSLNEVESFCSSVKNLHNQFLCSTCGKFLNYYNNLKIIRCSNPKCKDPIEVKTT